MPSDIFLDMLYINFFTLVICDFLFSLASLCYQKTIRYRKQNRNPWTVEKTSKTDLSCFEKNVKKHQKNPNDPPTFTSTKSLDSLTKVAKKTWKLSNFWNFCHFLVAIWAFFSLKNCVYFFTKASWTTNPFLGEQFYHLKPPSLSKVNQNSALKLCKTDFFWKFSVLDWIWGIFPKQFLYSKHSFLQRSLFNHNFFPFLNVFNILSQQVYQKLDITCIKTLKIWTFWNFCRFRTQFEAFFMTKMHLFLQKNLLDREWFSLLKVFDILSPEIYRKLDKNCIEGMKNWKKKSFLSFLGSFLCHSGVNQKNPEISTITYRMIPYLCSIVTNFTSVEFYGRNHLAWI